MVKKKLNTGILILLTIIIGSLLYSNSLTGGFAFDDWAFIRYEPAVLSFEPLKGIGGPRYIAYLTFSLNHLIGGFDPFGYHLVNVGIHILNTTILLYLVRSVTGTDLLNGIKSRGVLPEEYKSAINITVPLLFLIHPIQVHAVAYITQRFTSLATLFYLLSILFYLKFRKRYERGETGWVAPYLLTLVATIVAMKTKEIAFTIPFIILILEFSLFDSSEGKRRPHKHLIPLLLTLLIIPLSIFSGSDSLPANPSTPVGSDEAMRIAKLKDISDTSSFIYLITECGVILTYLRFLLLPANLHGIYDVPLAASIFEGKIVFAVIAVLSALILTIFHFIKAVKDGDRPLAILFTTGLLWFFVTISVESSIIPIRATIQEHRLYLPSIGFFLAISVALIKTYEVIRSNIAPGIRLKIFAAAVLITVAPPLMYTTNKRSGLWGDTVALYTMQTRHVPRMERPWNNLGTAYLQRGNPQKAIASYREAVALAPDNIIYKNNLALAYYEDGQKDEAIKIYEEILSLDNEKTSVLFNLAALYIEKREFKRSGELLERLLLITPDNKRVIKTLELIKGRAAP